MIDAPCGRRPCTGRRLLVLALAMLCIRGALAHDPFEITTEARLGPESFGLLVTMARSTARQLAAKTIPQDTQIEAVTFAGVQPALEALGRELFEVGAGGIALQARASEATLTVENDLQFRVSYTLRGEGPLRIDAVHLRRLPREGYGAVITVLSEQGKLLAQKVLWPEDSALELAWGGPSAEEPTPTLSAGAQFHQFLRLGFEHILTGYDHLLFLCGLLIACRRVRTMGAIITCFTLAHSLTLALAALDVVTLPGRIVEPLIAASIMFVGLENFARSGEPKGRWAVTFAFGLIHGFGFAGALRETGLGKGGASLLVPLFSFNLGVELGQIAVAAVFVPLLWQLRKWPAFARNGRFVLSGMVVLFGAYWLVRRVFFS